MPEIVFFCGWAPGTTFSQFFDEKRYQKPMKMKRFFREQDVEGTRYSKAWTCRKHCKNHMILLLSQKSKNAKIKKSCKKHARNQ